MTTVYLHPIGLDAQVWDGIAEPGDLAIDFPGFGQARPLNGPLSMAAIADYVAGLLTGPVDLVGLSLGSMISQHLAIRHPALVRSLVLCAGGSRGNAAGAKERAADARSAGMVGVLPSTLSRWFTPEALQALDHPGVAYVRDRLLRDDAETFAAYWDAMGEHHSTERLPEIAVPVTVVAAGGDRSVSVDTMRVIADAVPGAEFRVVDGPHLLHLEQPDAFRAVLAEHHARLAR